MTRKSAAPCWLGLSADKKEFVVEPSRSEIIERLFRDAASGIGALVISRQLNNEGVANLGTAPKWLPSSVFKILKNRAVLGEHIVKTRRGGLKTSIVVGEPVPNYYPRIISDQLFAEVQFSLSLNAKSGRGRKGEKFTNLFSGLLHCGHCAMRMKFCNSRGHKSLRCRTSNCSSTIWDFPRIETLILTSLSETLDRTDHLHVLSLPSKGQMMASLYQSRSKINLMLRQEIIGINFFDRAIDGPSRHRRAARHISLKFYNGLNVHLSVDSSANDVRNTY